MSVADPDLEIGGGGVGVEEWGSGGGHPDPEISGRPGLKKKIFRLFGPNFGPKIRGAQGPRTPPWIRQ